MPQPRSAARELVCALFASLAFVGPSGLVLGAEPKPQCTGWMDEYHPPPTVRVLRSKGPLAGSVEVVNFWKYVGTVLRAEYSSGRDKPHPWMFIGALTVKQYAWYYAGRWRGGKDAAGNCYDLKDTTADQIYSDLKADPDNPGLWIPTNVPTPANLKAMRATWHMTLRKWQADKNRSRIFLTGYRTGQKRPCGADATGLRMYQKSLRDCGVKKLTFEETLREYYEPNMLLVDSRDHDVLGDDSSWYGDLGLLSGGGGGTLWRLYPGTADSFAAAAIGFFAGVPYTSIVGQGTGNVDVAEANGANDARLLADLVMLVNLGGPKLLVARANGSGYEAPSAVGVPAGTSAQRLLVADFDGDLLADAGLLSAAGAGVAKLAVMRSNGYGSFNAPVDWWTGALDLGASDVALAGDTNGDGKADLIVRNATGSYGVANSNPSCLAMTARGPCAQVGAPGLAPLTPWLSTSWPAAALKHVVGDYDRDGRDDVIVVLNTGAGVKVIGMRSTVDARFADPAELWQSGVAFSDVMPVALDVNPDGMSDLALVQRDGASSRLVWLRAVERSTAPARMQPMTPFADPALIWSPSLRPF